MFPVHVLFITKGRYEVCSDDGRYSREFPTYSEATTFADALRNGKTEQEAQECVNKLLQRRERARVSSRVRGQAMKDLGLTHNRDGSYE